MAWTFSFPVTVLQKDCDGFSPPLVQIPQEVKENRTVSYLPFRRLALRKSSKM